MAINAVRIAGGDLFFQFDLQSTQVERKGRLKMRMLDSGVDLPIFFVKCMLILTEGLLG